MSTALTLLIIILGLVVLFFLGAAMIYGTKQAKKCKDDLLRSNRVLVLFSGGIDSTAALDWILRETNYDVHAHHIYLINEQNRYDIELSACRNIVQYLRQKYRDFEYTENTLSFPQFPGNDMECTRFVAAQMCKVALSQKRPYMFVVTGRIKTDFRDDFEKRSKIAQDVFDSIMSRYPPWQRPKFFYPLKDWDKTEAAEYLPFDLLVHTWSCREPKKKDEQPKCDKGTPEYYDVSNFMIPQYNEMYVPCLACTSCRDLIDISINMRRRNPQLFQQQKEILPAQYIQNPSK